MRSRTLLALVAAAAVLTGGAVAAAPVSTPVKGRVFAPAPQSASLYGTRALDTFRPTRDVIGR